MDNLNLTNNQDNQAWGGKREGSGRKVGSTTKPKLTDDLTDEQKSELLKKTLAQAMSGDARLMQFLLEQIYGKATQGVDLGGEARLIIEIAKQIGDKYDPTPYTDTSSSG